MALSKKQKAVLLTIGILLSVLLPVGFALGETFLSGFFVTQGTTHWNASNGPEVAVPDNYNLQSGNPFTANSFNLSTENNGHVNLSSNGATVVQVDDIEGTWTNVSALDVSGADLTIDPGDKDAATVGGNATALSYKGSMTAGDGTVDFVYSSSSGPATVTLRGLPSNTQLGAVDADTGTVLSTDTTTGSGVATFSGLDAGSHDVVLSTSAAPVVNDSTADPTGDLSTATPTLEIEVTDEDFDPGDEVVVEFFVDGSSIGTDTLTANGTASQTVASALDGGDHTWNVTATDEYGLSDDSADFTISTPDELLIRDETNATDLVDDAQINITAYESGTIIRRTSSDGSVDLTGFPVDEPIIVRAEADGYFTRTAVIEDIFEQNSMYLLNDTEPAYLIRFKLEDPSGDFPEADTVLFVERDLNVTGTVEWHVIAGDNFGVVGVPVNLVQDERYRLRIKNLETGVTATLGSFTAIQDETVTLSPDSASIEFEEINSSYAWESRLNDTSQNIIVEYEDTASQTQEVKITIHERFNTSNVLVDNQTFTGSNSIFFQQPLSNTEVNQSWAVVLYIDRGDGFMRFGPEAIGSGPRVLLPAALDTVWRTSVGVFILLIVAMAFSELNVGIGAIVTSTTGGLLWWIGLLPGGVVTTGPAVVLAIGISVAYQYRTKGSPT